MANFKPNSMRKGDTKLLKENAMLPDGSHPEGVDPVPPLNWNSKADLIGVICPRS